LVGSWEAPDWTAIPRMEGFFFEVTQALCNAIMSIGVGHYDYAITYIKRFKALIKPSGIFGQIRPSDKIGYKNADNFLKFRVFKICDSIITDLGKIKNYNKDYIKSILVNISSLICIINMYYMYAKTKVDFAGSYKPAFDIFEKEGL
jgi:hypothetical protein